MSQIDKQGLSKELETIINKAWSRGSNWAMKGFGYAMDTDCETEIELAKKLLSQAIVKARSEEREKTLNEVSKLLDNGYTSTIGRDRGVDLIPLGAVRAVINSLKKE